MAKRYLVPAFAAIAAVVAATVVHSANTLSEKQALLQGLPVASRAPAEQTVGRLIVKMRDGGSPSAGLAHGTRLRVLVESVPDAGLSHVREMAGGAALMSLGRPMSLQQARAVAARLAANPDVEYAEPDVTMKKLAVPTDTPFGDWQWNLCAPTSTYTGSFLSGSGTKSAPATGGANL